MGLPSAANKTMRGAIQCIAVKGPASQCVKIIALESALSDFPPRMRRTAARSRDMLQFYIPRAVLLYNAFGHICRKFVA